jgi:lactoylglutathione lyase
MGARGSRTDGTLPTHDGARHRPRAEPAVLQGARLPLRARNDIVRNGELEATNYFFGIGDQASVLELTYNHDGRTYELGTGYGHIAIAVDDLDATLGALAEQGIQPDREPYRVREGGSRLTFVTDPDGHRDRADRP